MDLKMILENAADESDESWLLLDDIEKSLENLYELYDKIHFASGNNYC